MFLSTYHRHAKEPLMIVLALMLALAGQTTSLPTPVEDRTPSTTAVRLCDRARAHCG
jgi:hypothetical protein